MRLSDAIYESVCFTTCAGKNSYTGAVPWQELWWEKLVEKEGERASTSNCTRNL